MWENVIHVGNWQLKRTDTGNMENDHQFHHKNENGNLKPRTIKDTNQISDGVDDDIYKNIVK